MHIRYITDAISCAATEYDDKIYYYKAIWEAFTVNKLPIN